MRFSSFLLHWLLIASVLACGPLTFENKGNVNFERYQSVYVLPLQIQGGFIYNDLNATSDAYGYLVNDLEATSGFRSVRTRYDAAVDAELSVWVAVREDYDYGEDVITYRVDTEFLLTDSEGLQIYRGSSSDSSESLKSAIENTLDEVSHFFIRPYRI